MALGQQLESFRKSEAVHFHNELEDVAAGAAAEAFVELARLVDVEGGGLLLMERAQAQVAAGGANAAQAHILADHFDDVDGRF